MNLSELILTYAPLKRRPRFEVEEIVARLIELFESCKERIVDILGYIKLTLHTMNWITFEEKDYLDHIHFTDLMNEWAGKEKVEVTLETAFDNSLDGNYGWWIMANPYQFKVESKHEVAIKMAMAKQPKPEPSRIAEILVGLAVPILFVVGIVATVYYYGREKQIKYLTKEDAENFFNGQDPFAGSAYDKKLYEIGREEFKIGEEPLGCGVFGTVFKGLIEREGNCMNVAVKMTHDNCTRTAIKGFLNEIKILSYLGKHDNIVSLVGAYTEELRVNVVYVFLEFCGIGSLQAYLRTFVDDEGGQEITQDNSELANDLKTFSREIANGMEYIAGKNVVHKDLATRNILLTNDKVIKICDFGLSQRLGESSEVTKADKDMLVPWRWMPPEALRKSEFTEKSDVWAFGVTLWEIYSLGEIPYKEISFNACFGSCLESGLRLGLPKYGKSQYYMVMNNCWETNPEDRPTFSELVAILSNINV